MIPSIDTTSRTGKLIMGILALIAEFENDIRRERQQDGINQAKADGVRFGPKPLLTTEVVKKIKELRNGRSDRAGNHAPDKTQQGLRLPSARVIAYWQANQAGPVRGAFYFGEFNDELAE